MITTKISILSILFTFAIVNPICADPDKSMSGRMIRIKPKKMDETQSLLPKRQNPLRRLIKSKKVNSKSEPGSFHTGEKGLIGGTRNEVDFLKAVEEKNKARSVNLDVGFYSSEFFRHRSTHDPLTSRMPMIDPSLRSDSGEFKLKSSPPGVLQRKTRLEAFRHLESKKEEVLKEIFLGFRFSFQPIGRHLILEMNATPSYEEGPGLIIPF